MDRIKIFLTNLDQYNQGALVGEWLKLPVTDEDELEALLKRIGVSQGSAEYFITDYESSIANLQIEEYASISQVNELATKIDTLCDWDYEKFCAVLEAESPSSISQILALLSELQEFDLISEISTEQELGEFYAECCGIFTNLPQIVETYFDFEKYGRDIKLQINGTFTSFGYLEDRR